jgi:branched-chain amino acid transport system substrate-binding protein
MKSRAFQYFFGLCILLSSLGLFLQSTRAQAPSEFTIGVLADLSGTSANIGEDCRRGYEVARAIFAPNDQAGSYKLKVVYADHQAEPKVGVTEFNRLTQQGAKIIVSNRSTVCLAMNPLSRKSQVPILGLTGTPDFIAGNPYAFDMWPSAKDEGQALATEAVKIGTAKVAILTTQDDWTLALRDAFKERLLSLGGEVVSDEEVLKGEIDFANVISKLKAKAPQAIFINLRPGQVGTCARRLREQGLGQQLIGNFYIRTPQEINLAGKTVLNGALYAEVNYSRPRFLLKFKQLFPKEEPTGVTYSAFAGFWFVLETLSKNPALKSGADVFRALSANKNIQLPDEEISLEGRVLRYALVVRRLEPG